MNVLFATVGMSSIRNAGIGAVGNRDNGPLRDMVKRYQAGAVDGPGSLSQLKDALIEAHESYFDMPLEYVVNPANYYQTSAELISTYQLFPLLAARSPARSIDRIVLLPSTTPQGRLAAEVVLGTMRSEKYQVPVEKSRITIRAVPGLDLDTELANLAGSLTELVCEYRTDPARDLVYFNVTGGFKGTGVVIGMLSGEGNGYALFYQHESLKVPIFINPRGRISRQPE